MELGVAEALRTPTKDKGTLQVSIDSSHDRKSKSSRNKAGWSSSNLAASSSMSDHWYIMFNGSPHLCL